MDRSVERLGCLLLCAIGVCAQQEAPKITVNIEGFRYPPIANAAHIQGDVTFEVSTSGKRLIAGSPLLAGGVYENLETWTLPPFEGGKYRVSYHFKLTEPGTMQETVLIGDRLDRFFLRLFHAPTERVVEVCDDSPTVTQVRQMLTKEGDDYVIDVFATAKTVCLTTSYLYL